MKPGDIAVIPGGVEHEGCFSEDSEAIDFFAPVREDFLTGAPPCYMTPLSRTFAGRPVPSVPRRTALLTPAR